MERTAAAAGVASSDTTEGWDPEGRKVSEVRIFREDVVRSSLVLGYPPHIGMVVKVGGDSDSDEDSEDDDEEEEEEEDAEEAQEQEQEEDAHHHQHHQNHHQELVKGYARILWLNSDKSTEELNGLEVLDRVLMHGDIVASALDPLGQTGTVVHVEMCVDLDLSKDLRDIVQDVDSRILRRVRAFNPGDYVINGHWLGRVEDVVDNVTVLFKDGSKCKVFQADIDRLVPVSEIPLFDKESPYYPGQRVRGASPRALKGAKWLRGSWKATRMEGTVVDVEAGSVLVHWISASATHSSAVPSEQQEAKNLVPMMCFAHTNWQLGDRTLLPEGKLNGVTMAGTHGDSAAAMLDEDFAESLEEEAQQSERDLLLPSSSSLELSPPPSPNPTVSDLVDGSVVITGSSCSSCHGASDLKDIQRRQQRSGKRRSSKQLLRRAAKKDQEALKKDKMAERSALVVNTRTVVDVLWQDGTQSNQVSACSLIPVDHLGDHDFWPERYVLERGSDGEGLENEVRRVGVVKTVDAKQRTAFVRWLKPVDRPEQLREFDREETVSVYELLEHPDYTYCLGDVVIRLPVALSSDPVAGDVSDECGTSSLQATSEVESTDLVAEATEEKRGLDQQAHKKANHQDPKSQNVDLSWVGIIVGLEDGDIEVAWANGIVSRVGPQAIFVVTRDDDDISSVHSSDLDDAEEDYGDEDAASWETVDSSDEQESAAEDVGGCDFNPSVTYANRKMSLSNPSTGEISGEAGPPPTPSSPRQFKGPIAAAIGLVSRMALGLLGFRDKPTVQKETAAGGKPSVEELIESSNDPRQSKEPWRVVDFLSPSGRNALQKLDAAAAVSEGEDNEETPSCTRSHAEEQLNKSSRLVASSEPAIPVDVEEPPEMHGDSDVTSEVFSQNLATFSVHEALDEAQGYKLQRKIVDFQSIKHFDSVVDPSDHHFVVETAQAVIDRKWAKKIRSEWSILEKNLPDTIYVRIYEDRMDLMRAVILGAQNTPYHDGLFVFDIYLPPGYPNTPPQTHYHSGGLRLNPNLYENGKVCLSLLNTWTGQGTEVWNPSTSSILQVLVSIQGLVLNAKPYFNEAGYDRQVGTAEGEKNSVLYNENAFLLSCKSMLYLLRRPPMHLELLIQQHFAQQGARLLQSCEAYLQGAVVGSLGQGNHDTFSTTVADRELVGVDKSSAGFTLMLSKLLIRLKTAFTELGVDCGL
jgi:ubiquitin-conjugating enzyme E2 O